MADETLTTTDGQTCPGYLNALAGSAHGVVLVLQEYWGLNAHIRQVTDRVAAEGFIAFAPDLYHGVVTTDGDEAGRLADELDWDRVGRDLKAAAGALRERYPEAKLGAVGFCLGGGVALYAASLLPELAACVPFYGLGGRTDPSRIRARVLGHYANVDDWCSPARVDAMEAQLRQAGVDVTFHRYDARHAFFNDTREVYSPKDARLAWDRTVQFLRETLG